MIFALALTSVEAGAARPSAVVTIPFEYDDGLLWLRVAAPGSSEPLEFLIDTGAASSVVDRQTAQRIGWPLRESVSVRGVDAQQDANWTPAERISFNGVEWSHKFVAVDLRKLSRACDRPVDGLLGADFFRGRVAQFDYAGQVLRLLPSSSVVNGSAVLPLRLDRGAFCVPLGVNGGRAGCGSGNERRAKSDHKTLNAKEDKIMCGNLPSLVPAGIGFFATVFGGLTGAFVSYRFLAIREFTSACGELHAAFAQVKIILEHNAGTKPPTLFTDSIPIHEKAIARFRFQLCTDRRRDFDLACQEYRQCRRPLEAEETMEAKAPQDSKPLLLQSINRLLAFADEAEAPRVF